MSILFEPTTINGMTLPNRFIRSATWEGMAATDGSCTVRLIDFLVKLADGGVGLIIPGHSYVSREGQAGPWQLGIHDDATLPGLTRLTEEVHRHGGKIAAQLAHAGAFADTSLTGVDAIAPSVPGTGGKGRCREITPAEIARVVRAFAEAAARARRCGFDAVQIHAAHGYLLSEFLSPAFNRRADEYGGPLANRGRIVLEVVRSVRQAAGPDYPVLIKLNSEDFIEGGFSV
jgi:2,4-dienoyl-CoA reductase-like NADH-dependent reductase (Old Yellow Enzyme family)